MIPRRTGTRINARAGPSGFSRFYFDLERRAFYVKPSRGVRSQRLDVRSLLSDPETARNFRVRKDGTLSFRGVNLGYKPESNAAPPPRLRKRKPPTGGPPPPPERKRKRPDGFPYFERVAAKSPGYRVAGTFRSGAYVTGVIVGPYGRSFSVTTTIDRAADATVIPRSFGRHRDTYRRRQQ